MEKIKVCIIGAGIGGLTAGALLTKKGYSVTIFEKESIIGGRALTLDMSSVNLENYKKLLSRFNMFVPFSEPKIETIFKEKMLDGYHLDLGFHVFGGGIASGISNATLDKNIEMTQSRLYISKKGNVSYFVTAMDKIKMLPNILRLFLAGEKTMKELDNVSLTETIKQYGKGKMKNVLELNPRLITTVNNLDNISTGEVFRTQKEMKLRGVRYPEKGLANVFNTLVNFIKQNGGEIYLNTPVSNIIINDDKAIGIVVKGKEISCDIVVSNILVQDLFKIANEKEFPKKYVNELKSLRGTASLCAYYSLKNIDKNLLGKNFAFIERNTGLDGDDVAGMVDFMITLPETGLSPPNKYLVQSYVICTPKEAKNKQTLEKLRKILDKNLENIIPDVRSDLIWAIYPAIWHLDGVAKTVENEKPEVKTPIENLYLIGDCVKAPGIGFNCALNSAMILKDTI
jgi:phytoene dehydrogenase-like protein